MGVDLSTYRRRFGMFITSSRVIVHGMKFAESTSFWSFHCCSVLRVAFILTSLIIISSSGDIELNPGPTLTQDQDSSCNDSALSLSQFKTLSLSSRRSLAISHLNIRSLLGKSNELSGLLHSTRLDILGISETWLNHSIPSSYFQPSEYAAHRHDRNRCGGGVLLFTRETLKTSRRLDLECDGLEIVWIELQMKQPSGSTLIACAYIPPGKQLESLDLLDEVLERATNENKHVIVVGDLNCNLAQTSLTYTRKLLDICSKFDLFSC